MTRPRLDIPAGYVIVPAPGQSTRVFGIFGGDGTVSEEHALRVLAYEPDALRLIPREWLAERDAMYEQHSRELQAFDKRVADSPRFLVTISVRQGEPPTVTSVKI